MFGESLLYFTTTKLLTVKNKRLGLFNSVLQMGIISYILWDLFHYELYKKVEIPSGYTAFWTETGNLTQIQENTDTALVPFCQNDTYNYAYDSTDWVYSNISCIKLPYAEMYEKGESEFFFLTHFTEYDIQVQNCANHTHKCLQKKYQDFFTIGVEGMYLVFDHFYTTTFEQGSNLGNSGLTLVDTYIKDVNDTTIKKFPKGKTIKLYVKDWLRYAGVNLDELNYGTPISVPHPYVPNPGLPYNRLSGVEIIIKVNYHNIKYFSGYGTPTCEITIQPNSGWSSKGSLINYLTYPNVSDVNDKYRYIDRYRYGIKFKFIVSGLMGTFNYNSLITHLVSGIVLVNMSTVIVSMVLMYFSGDFGKYFTKLRYTQTRIDIPCFKKCSQGKVEDKQNIELENSPIEANSTKLRKRVKKSINPNRYHHDIYLDSETSYNYSSAEDSYYEDQDKTNTKVKYPTFHRESSNNQIITPEIIRGINDEKNDHLIGKDGNKSVIVSSTII